jgi:hypothetical protein
MLTNIGMEDQRGGIGSASLAAVSELTVWVDHPRYYEQLYRLSDISGQSVPIFRVKRAFALRGGFC